MSWEDKKRGYMNQYVQENVLYKRINFSVNNPDDMEIWEYLKTIEEEVGKRKLSTYFKKLIKNDMKKQQS